MTTLAAVLLAVSVTAPARPVARPATAPEETRISVDFKDADILDIVRLMAELGDFQVVAHPGISCKLTLKLKEVPLDTAFDLALKTCGLGYEEDSGIYRIAPRATLTAEHAEARKLAEEQRLNRPLKTRMYRLSYAKAAEMAPLVKKFLSPRGEVIFDARTNTLIVTDIED
jgi:type II secretory pathway component HofQ